VLNDPINFVDPLGLFRNPSVIYDEALQNAQSSGLPGPWNGTQDAYRHCLASCMMTRENGQTMAEALGYANEKVGSVLAAFFFCMGT
jgi:hypothetical protein